MKFDLERFIVAQEPLYSTALGELRRGRKQSHWMWFIFPQIAGLGSSAMARHYAIGSLDEARAYLAHPLLGPRLAECTLALLSHRGQSASAILGPVDAMKLQSSMTLFRRASSGVPLFRDCLAEFFSGDEDQATLRLLDRHSDLPAEP